MKTFAAIILMAIVGASQAAVTDRSAGCYDAKPTPTSPHSSCAQSCNYYASQNMCTSDFGPCKAGSGLIMNFCKKSCNHADCACTGSEEVHSMTCSASSEYHGGYSCEKAIDGNSRTDWATNHQGAGAWIQLNFPGNYEVRKMSFTHRATGNNKKGELFKDLKVELSGGNTLGPFTLGNSPVGSYTFNFPAGLTSNYARVKIISHYTDYNNGFSDIRVYGCPV